MSLRPIIVAKPLWSLILFKDDHNNYSKHYSFSMINLTINMLYRYTLYNAPIAICNICNSSYSRICYSSTMFAYFYYDDFNKITIEIT